MERFQLTEISADELKALLTSYSIAIDEWGYCESKTVAHLLAELHKSESTLQETEDGKLLRVVRGVGINVFLSRQRQIAKVTRNKTGFF